MSKKQKKQQSAVGRKQTAKGYRQSAFNIKTLIALMLLLMITFIIYRPALKNSLTNWDDKNYVTINKDIQKSDINSIKNLFYGKAAYTMGNYHPITMLSYMIEYKYAKLDAKVYHMTNLLLHLLNTLLVFLFILLLTKNNLTALLTSFLFAVHPMHVESVAWVAERKDLLYVLFEMAALLAYTYYADAPDKRKKFYLLTFLLFLLSVMSKAMAVSLVVILPLIDYFKGRKLLNGKVIAEKMPFVVAGIIFGIIAIYAQKSSKSINFIDYSFYDRILFASWGFITYFWKCFLPIGLSTYYDYPLKGTYGWYIVYSLITIGIGWLVYKSMRFTKVILFGMLFFLFSVVLILQILPVGGAIIAERYTYAAYTGLFFIIAYGITYLIESKEKRLNSLKPLLYVLLAGMMITFMLQTTNRCEVWKDTLTIWNDALAKYPQCIKGYNGRGDAYNEMKEYDLALTDFNKAIEMKQDYTDAFYNRGIALYWIGKEALDKGDKQKAAEYFDKAISDNSQAIKYSPDLSLAYFNRAGNYFTTGKYELALADALKAKQLGIEVDSLFIKAIKSGIK